MRVWLCRQHPDFSQAKIGQQFWGDAQNPWAVGVEGSIKVPVFDVPTVSREETQGPVGQPSASMVGPVDRAALE
eukprot:1322386-Amphidinium_carterae.2